MLEIYHKEIEIYVTLAGKKPFIEWLEGLDKHLRCCIKERLDRMVLGNMGEWKATGNGIAELLLNFGVGYRIYFGWEGKEIILSGGDEPGQENDIQKAQQYWQDYLMR